MENILTDYHGEIGPSENAEYFQGIVVIYFREVSRVCRTEFCKRTRITREQIKIALVNLSVRKNGPSFSKFLASFEGEMLKCH